MFKNPQKAEVERELPQYKTQRIEGPRPLKLILRAFDDHTNFPLAVFQITDQGPDVLFQDSTDFARIKLNPERYTEFLLHLAISYMSTLAMGHKYIEGCFDLPAGEHYNYRTLLISLKLMNPNAKDPRLLTGYYQIVLFIPRRIHHYMGSYSKIESFLLHIVKRIVPTGDKFTTENIMFIKKKLLSYLSTSIQVEERIELFDVLSDQ